MKLFRITLAIILTIAFLNVIVGKAVHEIFEHEHVEHTCDVKDLTHFHEFEFTHLDFICDFNFSVSFLPKLKKEAHYSINYYQELTQVKYLWLVQNIYLDNLSLRGPPSIK